MASTDDILARLKRLHPLLIDLSLGRLERLRQRADRSTPLHGGGKPAERREVEVRRGDHLGRGGAPEALQTLATLDPADLDAELSRDADIVILALRDVDDLLLLEAVYGLPSEIV